MTTDLLRITVRRLHLSEKRTTRLAPAKRSGGQQRDRQTDRQTQRRRKKDNERDRARELNCIVQTRYGLLFLFFALSSRTGSDILSLYLSPKHHIQVVSLAMVGRDGRSNFQTINLASNLISAASYHSQGGRRAGIGIKSTAAARTNM